MELDFEDSFFGRVGAASMSSTSQIWTTAGCPTRGKAKSKAASRGGVKGRGAAGDGQPKDSGHPIACLSGARPQVQNQDLCNQTKLCTRLLLCVDRTFDHPLFLRCGLLAIGGLRRKKHRKEWPWSLLLPWSDSEYHLWPDRNCKL
jgi:hypothetical protein